MGITAEAVISVKCITGGLTLCCIIFRFFILRKASGHQMSRRALLSHITLLTASLCDFSATGLSAWVLTEEIRFRKIFSGDELDKYMATPRNSEVFFYSHLMYYIAICLIKLAYLFYYAELYMKAQTSRRFALPTATAIWAASNIAGIFVIFFWCAPFSDNWNPLTTNPNCPILFNVSAFVILGSMNIASDIAILVVPILIVSSLRVSRLEKRALLIIFAIGGTSIASSLVRIIVIVERLNQPSQKYTWDTLHVYMLWSHAEVFFGVLAFTLPGFRYLFVRWLGKHNSSSNGSQPTLGVSRSGGTLSGALTSQDIELGGKRGHGPPRVQMLDVSESQESLTQKSGLSDCESPISTVRSRELFNAPKAS